MNYLFKFSLAVLLVLLSSVPAFAQATLRATNFSTAVTASVNKVVVASASGIAAGDILFVEREAMKVLSIDSTTLTVRRGYESPAAAHSTSVTVYVDDPKYFSVVDKSGSCTSTSEVVLPVINIRNGKSFECISSVWHASRVDDQFSPKTVVTTDSTAAALTYTIAQLKGGLILRDPNGAGRSDVTPTAALLVAGIPGCKVGDSFDFVIRNTADAAETITLTAGTGATLSGTMTIAQNNSKRFRVVVDSLTAYSVYSLGTIVH
jgi:hypothetical protein